MWVWNRECQCQTITEFKRPCGDVQRQGPEVRGPAGQGLPARLRQPGSDVGWPLKSNQGKEDVSNTTNCQRDIRHFDSTDKAY